MRETRRLDIKKKIFTKSDILNIGRVFLDEYQSTQKTGHHSKITFKINSADGTSYESESIGLFEDGGVLDLKKTSSLEMTSYDYKLNQDINISVVHGGGYGCCLIVRGDDQNWVTGVFTRLKEIIDSIKPQENWVIKHKTLILHICALGIGTIIYFVFWFILYRHLEPIKDPSETVKAIRTFFETYPLFLYLVDWFLRWFMGIVWASSLRDWLLKLWPEIEFDFGPEHLKVEKLCRLRIGIIFSIAVIPIILSIGYDIVKSLLIR